jgi:hypothetical protein
MILQNNTVYIYKILCHNFCYQFCFHFNVIILAIIFCCLLCLYFLIPLFFTLHEKVICSPRIIINRWESSAFIQQPCEEVNVDM